MVLRNREWTIPFALVIISFLLKVFLVSRSPVINPDAALYLMSARFIREGSFQRALNLFPYPAFPYLISLVYPVVGDWLLAGRITSLLPSALCVAPLYGIIRKVMGPKAALYGSVAFVFAPMFNEASTWIIRDHLALLLGLVSILFTLQSLESGKIGYYLFALFFILLATVTKIEYGVLLIAWVACGFTEGLRRKSFLACLAIGAAVLLGGALLIYPGKWSEYLRIEGSGESLKAFLNRDLLENYRSVYNMLTLIGQKLPNAYWHPNFSDIAKHYIPVIYLLGCIETHIKVVNLPFFIAIFPGLKNFGHYRHKLPLLLFFVASFLPGYGSLLFRNFITSRYVFLSAALLFIPVGAGFYGLRRRFIGEVVNSPLKRRIRVLLALVIGILILTEAFFHAERRVEKSDSSVVDASLWLRSQRVSPSCYVASDDPRIGWYWDQGDRFVLIPLGSVPQDSAVCYFITNREVDQGLLEKEGFCKLAALGRNNKAVTVYGRNCPH